LEFLVGYDRQQPQLRVRRHLRPAGQPVGADDRHRVCHPARADRAHLQGHLGRHGPARRGAQALGPQVHGHRGVEGGQSGGDEADGRREQHQGDGGRVAGQDVLRPRHRIGRRARAESQGRRRCRRQ